MLNKPYYDPEKSYASNLEEGPFGAFADGQSYEHKGEPEYELWGHKLYTPFGIPAGPLPNYNFIKAAFAKGFDINIYKTVRTKAKETHPWPNVLPVVVDGDLTLEKAQKGLVTRDEFAEPLAITNSFGVGSMNPDQWQPDMRKAVESAREGQVMIGSFQGTNWGGGADEYIADHVLGSKLVKETGAQIMEMNLSCPNEGTADLLCYDTDRVVAIADKVKNQIGDTPLILKIAYFKDKVKFDDFISKLSKIVDGFAAINTIASEIRMSNGEQALPGEGRLISGACGAPIKWAGLEMVDYLVRYRALHDKNFKVIGVGGVMNIADYIAYVNAGADIVMSATGSMWNPYLGQEINEKLNQTS